jgi:hypothetical protein
MPAVKKSTTPAKKRKKPSEKAKQKYLPIIWAKLENIHDLAISRDIDTLSLDKMTRVAVLLTAVENTLETIRQKKTRRSEHR